MWNKQLIIFFSILCSFNFVFAQECTLELKGHVFDEASQSPLEFVTIFLQEESEGTVTDGEGNFVLNNVCAGEYHLIVSHIGCEAQKIRIDLETDTILQISLSHSPHSLNTVVVEGDKDELIFESSSKVNRQAIEDNSNQNLAALLENETGVHLIKNGNKISKPIVQGQYGNRLTILNNGVIQNGQQWGNDHSPEIDPFAADNIIVLKGVSSIEYGGSNLGSVILVEPKPIEKEDHLHGQVNYAFETNGQGHNINARLEKYDDFIGWKVSGTLKKYGDNKAPNYFLRNTGLEEANLALQLEKTWEDKLFFNFYASTFNTEVGVLRGSHIGNLTDLEAALSRDVPFFTEPAFNYQISAPRQDVSHHLAKAQAKYFIDETKILDLVVAGQINDRKEFDIRRGEREDKPALSLLQTNFNVDFKYTQLLTEDLTWKSGIQYISTDNDNKPTGISPLIPDYNSWQSGLFSTVTLEKNKNLFNLGLRYDYEYQQVFTISKSLPRRIIELENNFHNFSVLAAVKLNLGELQILHLNSGFSTRNPAINELYSAGLHQGVSGIEEGNENLKSELSLKNSVEYKWVPSSSFSFSTTLYHQRVKDYIYLQPQNEFRLTIRGAFPVFIYEQTDANIFGLDVSTQVTLSNTLLATLKYSAIQGTDILTSQPLVFIPPNSLFSQLIYRVKRTIDVSQNVKMEETELGANFRYVFEQKNFLDGQDFVAPPDAYSLIGLKASTNLITPKNKIRCFIKVDNLLNSVYRDYLNRHRYFADDLGISFTSGISFKF